MTMLNTEAKTPEPEKLPQSDTNLSQQNVDTNLSQDQQTQQITEQSQVTNEDPDWRKFREARKKDREERNAAEARAAEKEREAEALKAALEAAFVGKSAPSAQAYQQYYGMDQSQEETEEQRIERMVEQKLAKKEAEYKKQHEEEERRSYPQRILRDMPDFNQVCSQENMDYFDYHYPELSRTLQRLPEGYDKWHDAYHQIKKFVPNHATAKKEAMRADINSNKPRSMSTAGPSPTGERSQETWQEVESRRAQRYAEMQRAMKGV